MKKLISVILCFVIMLCVLPLQVFAAPITRIEVTGIDVPVIGEAPDMDAVASDGYYNHANRILWKEYDANKSYQRDLSASDTFRVGYYYAVYVTVFSNTDMPFTSATTGKVNGKSAQIQDLQSDGCSIVIVYNFEEMLKEPVNQLELTVPAPIDGEKPDYTKLEGNSYYSDNGLNGTSTRIYKNGIAWYKSATSVMTPGTGEVFNADTDYQLKISLLPKTTYFFHENITVTINGKLATVEFFDDGSINASVTLKASEPPHTHTPSEWRTTGIYHYKACTTCGDFLEQEDHKGGAATCAKKGKCTVCCYEYIDVHENHTPDTSKWVIREDMYHYHACKICGAHCDIGEHVAGPAGTPDAAVVCRDCGYVITPAKVHTHSLTKVAKKDATCTELGNVEYYTCDGCTDIFADSEGKTTIPDAGIAPLGHKTSDDWKHDDSNHWRICTVCNEVLTETQQAHEMDGGKCTTCSYKSTVNETEPATTPPESNTAESPAETTDTPKETTDTPKETTDSPKETTGTPKETTEVAPPNGGENNDQGFPWWGYVLIAIVVVGAGIGIAFIFAKLKKKS